MKAVDELLPIWEKIYMGEFKKAKDGLKLVLSPNPDRHVITNIQFQFVEYEEISIYLEENGPNVIGLGRVILKKWHLRTGETHQTPDDIA